MSPPILQDQNPYKQQLLSFRQNRYITNQSHPNGTIIYKDFENPITGQIEEYRGEIMYFDKAKQLYTIFYNDGDEEEMDGNEIKQYLVSNKSGLDSTADQTRHPNGTIIHKQFLNEYTGEMQKYSGEIMDFDETEQLYRIKYTTTVRSSKLIVECKSNRHAPKYFALLCEPRRAENESV